MEWHLQQQKWQWGISAHPLLIPSTAQRPLKVWVPRPWPDSQGSQQKPSYLWILPLVEAAVKKVCLVKSWKIQLKKPMIKAIPENPASFSQWQNMWQHLFGWGTDIFAMQARHFGGKGHRGIVGNIWHRKIRIHIIPKETEEKHMPNYECQLCSSLNQLGNPRVELPGNELQRWMAAYSQENLKFVGNTL